MQTEDLLAACLDAQAQGGMPAALGARGITREQRAELESLLTLAERLRRLGPPPPSREVREAMATRLLTAMRRPLAAHPSQTWA